MKTSEDIKKALQCRSNLWYCILDDCIYYNDKTSMCSQNIARDALGYVQRLERQISELTEKVMQLEALQQKWISVEDRLPDVEVLAANFAPKTYGYKEYIIGYVSRGTEPGKCYAENDFEILYNVTHWMPLPEPPKEDVKNE